MGTAHDSPTFDSSQLNSPHSHSTAASRYISYQMFAFVRDQGGCVRHVPLLKRLGYIPLIRATPVNVSAITTNDWYLDHVRFENCCGAADARETPRVH